MFTSRRKTLFNCILVTGSHGMPQRIWVSHKQIPRRNECLGKQANKKSDIIITHRANGRICIPPSFYPKDYLLYSIWTCPPVMCRTGELQSVNNWLSLASSPKTYPLSPNMCRQQKPQSPLNSAATEASWKFSEKGAKKLLETPFFISARKLTLIRAHPSITHLSYRA